LPLAHKRQSEKEFLTVVRRSLAVLVVLNVIFVAGAQQTQNPNAPPPAPEKNEAPKVPSVLAPDTTGLPIDPKSYVIGPEDIINVKVWREQDFTGPKGVRPDGKITMPLIGDVQAAGLTPLRLSDQLKQALSEYVKEPDVTVEVLQVNSKKYSISGGVNRPGQFPLVVATKVFDALNLAGGFRDFANKKDILIIRADGKRFHFNYNAYIKGKKLDQNIELQNGDTVIVKE
jgi:polysaccharide biosynthesis/export protein